MKKTYLTLLVAGTFVTLFSLNSCSSDDDSTPKDVGGGDTTTFAVDIQPIITTNCSPCHVAGGARTNYTTYNNAANAIDLIITRVNLEESDPAFMPQGGTQLSQANLDLLAKWKTDGLKE